MIPDGRSGRVSGAWNTRRVAALSPSDESEQPHAPSAPSTTLPTIVVDDEDDVDVDALVSAADGPSNLADLVAGHARQRGDEPALVESGPEGRVLTWAEVDDRVSALAAGLARRGVLAGHRLALRAPTSVPYVLAYLAALRAGVVAVPMAARAGDELSARWLIESGARLLLTTGDHDAGHDVDALPLTDDGLLQLADPMGPPVISPPDREALAVLLYTAGTAEEPRPVMLSHRALLAGVEEIGGGLPDAESVIGLVLPLSGAYGLVGVIGSWIAAGCRLVVADERTDLASLAEQQAITHLPLTPPLLVRMLQRATAQNTDLRGSLGTVIGLVSAGARLPWPLVRELTERTGLRLAQAYGLTETGRGIAGTLGGEMLGPGHVGRALPGAEIRIGDGSEDEPGEISVRGPMLFSGYWPDATGGPDQDGWWPTGDLGYLHGDELYVLGRSDDLVSVSGFTVYPAEVEQTIAELEGVDAVAVLGTPDAGAGQRLVAVVAGSATPDQVAEHCRLGLPVYKRPREIRQVDALPRTVTGMIRRGALRRQLAEERP